MSSGCYWPGAGTEAYFYAHSAPEPEGFPDCQVRPTEPFNARESGEFLLPSTAVRTADDPGSVLLSFVQGTYEAAAVLGKCDRAALGRRGGR